MRCKLTHARLLEVLQYDASSGEFHWLVRLARNVQIGSKAGAVKKNGYVLIAVDKEQFLAHRLAWFYKHGAWPPQHVDHINGRRGDNRLSNLRLATHAENMQNIKTAPAGAKNPLLGVSPNKMGTAFRAFIKTNSKQTYLGTFPTAVLAHSAYVAAKRIHHPMGTL